MAVRTCRIWARSRLASIWFDSLPSSALWASTCPSLNLIFLGKFWQFFLVIFVVQIDKCDKNTSCHRYPAVQVHVKLGRPVLEMVIINKRSAENRGCDGSSKQTSLQIDQWLRHVCGRFVLSGPAELHWNLDRSKSDMKKKHVFSPLKYTLEDNCSLNLKMVNWEDVLRCFTWLFQGGPGILSFPGRR